MATEHGLDLTSETTAHGLQMSDRSAAPHDREPFAVMLDRVQEVREPPGGVGGGDVRHRIRLSDLGRPGSGFGRNATRTSRPPEGMPRSVAAMSPRPTSPRISPLPADERVGQYAELLDGLDANIFRTLVRAPGLFRRWLPFGGKLLAGKLPPRDRELLILRTSVNCDAVYEWSQHVSIGQTAGLTPDEIDHVATREIDGWAPLDAALLRAADELHDDTCITDATWAVLAEHYDTQQLIELPMLVGQYHMVAMTLNSLGVEVDAGLPGFPA